MAKKVRLKVPLARQGKGTNDCGPTCASMIVSYYSTKKNVKDVIREVREIGKKYGLPENSYTYPSLLGIYLIRLGFKVEIVTFNPWLFNYQDKKSKNMAMRLKSLLKYWEGRKVAKGPLIPLKLLIDFVNSGGKLDVRVPDRSDIIEEIKKERPLIAILTSNFLYKTQELPSFNFHFNVVTGIDKDYVYVNDPIPEESMGGKRKYLINEFLFGVYASAHGAFDWAALIKIKK